MAYVKKHSWSLFIHFDPPYKSNLYTVNAIKTLFLAKNPQLHRLISWIKGCKLHKMKNIDRCHTWIPFLKFDPTSKFMKTWFLCFLVFKITTLIWIKGNKLHSKKNIDKCHIWISFIIFNPTSKFRKTQFLWFYVVYF